MYSAMSNLSVKAVDAALMYRVKLAAMGRQMKLRDYVIQVLEEATNEHSNKTSSSKGTNGSETVSDEMGDASGVARGGIYRSKNGERGRISDSEIGIPGAPTSGGTRRRSGLQPEEPPTTRTDTPDEIDWAEIVEDFEPQSGKQETRLTFDDLGELKVKIKCWCHKLMRAAEGSDDTMVCPSGHQKALIELRREGKL